MQKTNYCYDTNTILNRLTNFKIDTGVDASIISRKTLHSLKEKLHAALKVQLHSPGARLTIMGQFHTDTVFKGQKYSFRIVVVDNNCNNLFSMSVATKTYKQC